MIVDLVNKSSKKLELAWIFDVAFYKIAKINTIVYGSPNGVVSFEKNFLTVANQVEYYIESKEK